MIKVFDTYIEKRYDTELLRIDAWGKDSFRVRSFADRKFTDENYALNKVSDSTSILQVVDQKENEITVKNGKLTVVIDHRDRITFYDENNKVLLQEFIRLRAVKHDDGAEDVGTIEITKDFNSTLKLKSREFKTNLGGGSFETTTRFESNPKEKIFGMGQYQHEFLNLKNTKLELAQRNSQMSIPFYISSLGYGFLWNNPGIGEVTFAKNITEWHMESTNVIDYWITTGDTLKDISKNYADVTGKVPLMPKKLLGLWQSKLRYRTPDEVLDVVKRYHEKGIQLSTIAIDYFHWPKQGE